MRAEALHSNTLRQLACLSRALQVHHASRRNDKRHHIAVISFIMSQRYGLDYPFKGLLRAFKVVISSTPVGNRNGAKNNLIYRDTSVAY